jgi:hypothetical protein
VVDQPPITVEEHAPTLLIAPIPKPIHQGLLVQNSILLVVHGFTEQIYIKPPIETTLFMFTVIQLMNTRQLIC